MTFTNFYGPSSFGTELFRFRFDNEDGSVISGPFTKEELALSLVTSARLALLGDVAYVQHTVVCNAQRDTFFIYSHVPGIVHGRKWYMEKNYRPGDKTLSGRSLSADTWKAILYHFILRFICRSADTGLWNVSIGPDGRPYGMDFEEVRGKEKAIPTNLWDLVFLRKPARVYWPTIRAVMEEAKPIFATLLREKVIPHLTRIGRPVGRYSDRHGEVEREFLTRVRLALSLCV